MKKCSSLFQILFILILEINLTTGYGSTYPTLFIFTWWTLLTHFTLEEIAFPCSQEKYFLLRSWGQCSRVHLWMSWPGGWYQAHLQWGDHTWEQITTYIDSILHSYYFQLILQELVLSFPLQRVFWRARKVRSYCFLWEYQTRDHQWPTLSFMAAEKTTYMHSAKQDSQHLMPGVLLKENSYQKHWKYWLSDGITKMKSYGNGKQDQLLPSCSESQCKVNFFSHKEQRWKRRQEIQWRKTHISLLGSSLSIQSFDKAI